MRKILVAVDGSPAAKTVIAAAAELAQRFHASLVIHRAVGVPAELPREALTAPPDDLSRTLVTRALRELEDLAEGLSGGISRSINVEVGTPWESICSAAKREGADLVVVGSHGYRWIDRALGTTASRVVNHAQRSVHVVWVPGPPVTKA